MSFQGHRGVSRHDGSTPDSWLTYVCGHCNTQVTGAVVSTYAYTPGNVTRFVRWLLCPNCVGGSVQSGGEIYPGAAFGPKIEGLPDEIVDAYQEARRCMEVNAYTAAELICRKLLMHIAVEKGADEGDTFAAYLSYLEGQGYVTPPMKRWVDIIRQHGNKATHRLEAPSQERAESTVMFTAELLRLIYEMEHMSNKFAPPDNET